MRCWRLACGILMLFACGAAQADTWKVESRTDSMTDEVRKTATGTNAQGFGLAFYRDAEGQVLANFSLPPTDARQLDPRHFPMYRIDKGAPTDLERTRALEQLGLTLAKWEPKWINFVVWHGEGAPNGEIVEFMRGQRVVFRYWLGGGGYSETAFDLSGAGPVIAEALGVDVPRRTE
jgi:hypothetical protein